MKLVMEGEVVVEGSDITVGGMDLDKLLKAAFPSLLDERVIGTLRITVEVP